MSADAAGGMKVRLFRMQNKLFISFALVVGGALLAVGFNLTLVVNQQAGETIAEDLKHSLKVFDALQREKTANLAALLQNISETPRLKAALDLKKQDPATVTDLVPDIKGGLELFQVADKRGRLLASFMGDVKADIKTVDPSATAFDGFFAKAVDAENPLVAVGPMSWSDRLFLTITGPVLNKDRVIGGLRAGFEITAKQAQELKEQTGSEVAFALASGKIIATSLTPDLASALEKAVAGMGDLDTLSAASFEKKLNGIPFLIQLAPLNDPAGRNLGWQIQLRNKSQVLALLSRIRRGVTAIGLTALVLAIGLAYLIARGITSPLKALVQGTRAVDRGDLDYTITVETRDELGLLADAFNTMIRDLKEKERVKALFGRYLPKAVADRAMANPGELMLGGEEREVAVFFSDVRGFTSLSENIAPQNLVAMLNEYFTRMVDILLEHEGTLDKYIGDAIMAVFGAPVADPEASTRAVRTALGMMAALDILNREFTAKGWPKLEIGIGINAGPVVAGNLGSIKQLSYTVIGEEVNLASRLCSKAAKGQILVSESVYRKVKWQFEMNRLEPITVKNVSHPVQVYEVVGVKADAAPPA